MVQARMHLMAKDGRKTGFEGWARGGRLEGFGRWAWRMLQMPHRVTATLQQVHNLEQILQGICHNLEMEHHHPESVQADQQIYKGYTKAGLALFDRFTMRPPPDAMPGFITDFLGVRTRAAFVKGAERLAGNVLGTPVPDDGWHSEAIEYIGLLKSVASANGRFTAMELGAGWAPWSIAGAAAARFPKLLDPSTDFGSRPQTAAEESPTDHVGRQFADWVDLDILPFAELLRGEPAWDLVHIDVQGWETDLCLAAGPLLDERVRWLVIGTHDAKLHGELLNLMFRRSWILENEKPPRFTWINGAPTLLAMTTHDGTQVWRNPRLSL